METTIKYGKPSMTNLPKELGQSIINTIMNTPASDGKEAEKKADELEKKILAARKEK